MSVFSGFFSLFPWGVRTIRVSRRFHARRDKIWNAIFPLGLSADWHHSVLTSQSFTDAPDRAQQTYTHLDRHGEPIVRTLQITQSLSGTEYTARVLEDSALDAAFWTDVLRAPPSCRGRRCDAPDDRADRPLSWPGLSDLPLFFPAARDEIPAAMARHRREQTGARRLRASAGPMRIGGLIDATLVAVLWSYPWRTGVIRRF